jgi:hypothetical protein
MTGVQTKYYAILFILFQMTREFTLMDHYYQVTVLFEMTGKLWLTLMTDQYYQVTGCQFRPPDITTNWIAKSDGQPKH